MDSSPGYQAGILTISDKGARGDRKDTSGPQLVRQLSAAGFIVSETAIIPDHQATISDTICKWVDLHKIDLVITTGGTGVSPSDITPEATSEVIERKIPGIAEAMRAASLKITPRAMLSRGIAGIRNNSLIINLPGSEKAARENMEVVIDSLNHAIYKIRGGSKDCTEC